MAKDFFDIFEEKDDDFIKDLVLVTNSVHLKDWIDKLSFMKLNYNIITNVEEEYTKENLRIMVTKLNLNSVNTWKVIYNKFRSYNYLIIGDNDTSETFEILYSQFMESGESIWINNNNKDLNTYNHKFEQINKYIDYGGNKYMIFKNNYLKLILGQKNNHKTFRHSLVYYRNRYKDNIKSSVVEYLGDQTPITNKDKNEEFFIRIMKFKLVPVILAISGAVFGSYYYAGEKVFDVVIILGCLVILVLAFLDIFLSRENY